MELNELGEQFSVELQSLASLMGPLISRLEAPQFGSFFSSLVEVSKTLHERTEPCESISRPLLSAFFSIRFFFLQICFFGRTTHPSSDSIKLLMDTYAAERLKPIANSASILSALSAPQSSPSEFNHLLLQLSIHIFQLYAQLDAEGARGRLGWELLSFSSLKNLSGELRWSLLLLVSAINTNALIDDNTTNDVVYWPCWDAFQELQSLELLKTPQMGRNSPTKDPTGPSRGIQDLLNRFKYFCHIWRNPSMEVQSLMGRFFAERLHRISSRSLQFLDLKELETSSNTLDQYLFVIHSHVLADDAGITASKRKIVVAKLSETFLNVLDTLEATNLNPEIDIPPLIRNCFQVALTLLPNCNDQQTQEILLERLLSVPLSLLSPLSTKITIQGLFHILSVLSSRQRVVVKKEKEKSIFEEFQDFEPVSNLTSNDQRGKIDTNEGYIRNIDSELVDYPRSRKRIVEHLSTTCFDHIISEYLLVASSSHSGSLMSNPNIVQSTTANSSEAPSKRQKTLDISSAATPFLDAEKNIITYLKQTKLIYEHTLSGASIGLLSTNRICDLLANPNVSELVRFAINDCVKALIIYSRKTSLEVELRAKWDTFWNFIAKNINSPSMPSKLMHSTAYTQGLILYAMDHDKKYDWFEFIASGGYKKDAIFRQNLLFSLRAWIDLVTSLLKINVYTSTRISEESGIWIAAILINASLEQNISSSMPEILIQLQALTRIPKKQIPISLSVLANILHDGIQKEVPYQSIPTGFVAKTVLEGILNFRSRQPEEAYPLTPHFTKLIRHMDDVVERNRSELAANGNKFGRYDDSIYDFVSYCFKTIPHWLHSKADARYNVFGRLLSELFIEPIRVLAPTNNLNASSETSLDGNHQTSSSHYQVSSVKTASGMVFGRTGRPGLSANQKNGPFSRPSASSSASSSSPSSSSPHSNSSSVNPPTSINENAIRYLPFALNAIAQLPFENDGDLQRYLREIITGVFRCFITGNEASYDTRLFEQFAAGLVATSTTTSTSLSAPSTSRTTASTSFGSGDSQTDSIFGTRVKKLRTFFWANMVPWIKQLIEEKSSNNPRNTNNAFDTNCFVLARLLSWIFLKLKHTREEAAQEIIRGFIMSTYYVLDLYCISRPTKSSLAKKEMLNFAIIFCSTLSKVVPRGNVMSWLQSNEVWLYEQLLSALRGWVSAVVRDLDYISTGVFPPAHPEAHLHDDMRREHINQLFTRNNDTSETLSTLALVDKRGSIDSLKELVKSLCEILNFVRILGSPQLISNAQHQIKNILYLPDESSAVQRHSRADIKASLEIARKEFGRINYLITSSSSPNAPLSK